MGAAVGFLHDGPEAGDVLQDIHGDDADDGIVDAGVALVVADEVGGVEIGHEPGAAIDDAQPGAGAAGLQVLVRDLHESRQVAGADGDVAAFVRGDVWRAGKRLLQVDVAVRGDGGDFGRCASEVGHDGETHADGAGIVRGLEAPGETAACPCDLRPDTTAGLLGEVLQLLVNDAVLAVEIDHGLDTFVIDGQGLNGGLLGRGEDRGAEGLGEETC